MSRCGVLIRAINDHALDHVPADISMAGEFFVASPGHLAASRISDHSFFQQLTKWGLVSSPLAVDLYILATGCYVADQRIPRRVYAEDSWSRIIDLFVPVSDPEFWTQQTELINEMLGFLSGDYWRVHFRPRGDFPTFTHTGQTLPAPNTSCVSLFSGGLDSFIGAINLLEAGENPILVGQYSSPDVASAQKHCWEAINRKYAERARYIDVYIGVPKNLLYGRQENSMRSRSFLFFSIGTMIAASLLRPATLVVPENGFISLNLPLSLHRLGALSTKTTHPYFMISFQKLLNRMDLSITIQNPFQFKTKGQMVADCANQQFLRNKADETMSCSHPAQARFEGYSPTYHCGTCVPCLIRKAALYSAWGQDPTHYIRHNLIELANEPRRARNANVIDFLATINRFRQRAMVSDQDLLMSGPIPDMENLESYREVYVRGLEEIVPILGMET